MFKQTCCPHCQGILDDATVVIAEIMSGVYCPHCHRYIAEKDIQYY